VHALQFDVNSGIIVKHMLELGAVASKDGELCSPMVIIREASRVCCLCVLPSLVRNVPGHAA
jgi:hypothetical protein